MSPVLGRLLIVFVCAFAITVNGMWFLQNRRLLDALFVVVWVSGALCAWSSL